MPEPRTPLDAQVAVLTDLQRVLQRAQSLGIEVDISLARRPLRQSPSLEPAEPPEAPVPSNGIQTSGLSITNAVRAVMKHAPPLSVSSIVGALKVSGVNSSSKNLEANVSASLSRLKRLGQADRTSEGWVLTPPKSSGRPHAALRQGKKH